MCPRNDPSVMRIKTSTQMHDELTCGVWIRNEFRWLMLEERSHWREPEDKVPPNIHRVRDKLFHKPRDACRW